MVVIRLARGGAKKKPFYRIVVADSRFPCGGRHIENLGFFNPVARGKEEKIRLNRARVQHWVEQGAQLSQRVRTLVEKTDKALEAATAA